MLTAPPDTLNAAILICDDQAANVAVLTEMLQQAGYTNVTVTMDSREVCALHRANRYDLILLDLQMPHVDGLEAIAAIRGEFPKATLIVLTSYPGDARVMRALTLGATSYLLKSATLEEIIKAIRASVAGRHVVASEVAHEIARHAGSDNLTSRETSVLRLAAAGQSNKAIAEALFVSEDTVKSRMRSIMAKLGALDRTHAVMIAVQRGFLDS